MKSVPAPSPLLCWVILLFGVFATACSFVFIRESSEPPVMLAAWRVLLASIMLFPAYWLARQRHGDSAPLQVLKRSLFPGIVLAAHFITWVIGARLSLGVNATIIVSLVPLALPIIVWILFSEAMQKLEWIATALALSGLAVLAFDGMTVNSAHLTGDAICLVSMVLFALYLALARRSSHLPSLWLYVVPVYAVSGVASLLAAPFFGPITPQWTAWNVAMVFALAGVSTVIGHSALNFAMQHMRSQTVGVMTLAQFVVAGVIAYFLYQEVPSLLFYPASFLMVLGMALVVLNQKETPTEPQDKQQD